MGFTHEFIEAAVGRYDRERDRYLKLAQRIADICRASIVEENAVRAQITFRTKTLKSFRGKLERFSRNPKKQFASVDEVFNGIGDFAGVRVATYRAEDEAKVTELICQLFAGPRDGAVDVDPKDKLIQGGFYRATHCQVCLKDEDLVGNYENLKGTSCEIQICTMMAHVWNEIEHDIGYKPEGDGPTDTEAGMLEALGHLTRSGDAMITRLLAATSARLEGGGGDFVDVHDFVARLRGLFPEADLSVNAGQAFEESMLLDLKSVDALQQALGANYGEQDAVAMIGAFNAWAQTVGGAEHLLNSKSADVVIVGLLDRMADRVVANHPAGRGRGRPPRIYYLAKDYQRFAAERAERAAA